MSTTATPAFTLESDEHDQARGSGNRIQFEWVRPGPSDAELLAIRAALSQHLSTHHTPSVDGH
jgi:hypothetical protein